MKSDEPIVFPPTLPEEPHAAKPSSKRDPAVILPWAIVALLLITFGALYFTHRLQFNGAQTGKETANVCDENVVKQYNSIMQNAFDTTQTAKAATQQKIQAIVDTFKKDSSYINDPTCLFLSYASAMNAGKKEEAKTYVDKIAIYADQGSFIDTRVVGVTSVMQLQETVKAETNATGDGLGSG